MCFPNNASLKKFLGNLFKIKNNKTTLKKMHFQNNMRDMILEIDVDKNLFKVHK